MYLWREWLLLGMHYFQDNPGSHQKFPFEVRSNLMLLIMFSISATNSWEDQLARGKVILAHGFGSFSPWLVGLVNWTLPLKASITGRGLRRMKNHTAALEVLEQVRWKFTCVSVSFKLNFYLLFSNSLLRVNVDFQKQTVDPMQVSFNTLDRPRTVADLLLTVDVTEVGVPLGP